MTGLAGRRIMVVEDSYFLAMEVKSALEDAGAEVSGPFGNGDNALGSLRQSLPDCAVLDVDLGEGDSLDLARALRMRGVPFLFFTGYDASALPPEFTGVDRLEKPVAAAHLVKAVERCCGSASAPG